MEISKLKRFAQFARRTLTEQITAKLDLVLLAGSPARRESLDAVNKLENAIHQSSRAQVVERVAYTWFNRFCALRFMDVNGYNAHSSGVAGGWAVPARDPGRGQDGTHRRRHGAQPR
jgi:hypothetical protein